MLVLVAIAVAIIVAVGLLAAVLERGRAVSDRRKLEKELDHTYGRLREAEAALASATARPRAHPATERRADLGRRR